MSQGGAREEAAAHFLKTQGNTIVERNWRCKAGEVDLICLDHATVVFVEVWTRTEPVRVTPARSITPAKIFRLAKAASRFLSQLGWWDKPCRFDLISVTDTGQDVKLEHISDAFDFPQTVGRGHAPRQPW